MQGPKSRADGREAARLLDPLPVARFLAEHWERAPLFLPGSPARLTALELDADELLAFLDTGSDHARRKLAWKDTDGVQRERVVDPRAPLPELAGSTLCVTGIDAGHPGCARLAAGFKLALGVAGDVLVNAYLSAPGAGFACHFDTQSVLVLQLAGRKRWRVGSTPALPAPPRSLGDDRERLQAFAEDFPWADVTPIADTSWLEHTLAPGDLLYIPSGTWHATSAQGRSLALSLTCTPYTACALVADALRPGWDSDPAWRAPLPPVPCASQPPDRLPRALEIMLAQRLEAYQRAVASLTVADLYPAWRRALAAGGSAAPQEPEPPLSPQTRLERADTLPLAYAVTRGSVWLFHRALELELPLAAQPFLARLADSPAFVAGDARGWLGAEPLAWEDVLPLLETLLAQGVLVRQG